MPLPHQYHFLAISFLYFSEYLIKLIFSFEVLERWDLILEYGFAFLMYMYESYLLFFNDWQFRLIIARCLTFVPPFQAQEVFLGLIPPCLSILVVVQSLCYGCQFWTVSHEVEEHWLSSFSIYHQCLKQTFCSFSLCSAE